MAKRKIKPKRKLTAEDKAELALWEAKRESAVRWANLGDLSSAFALTGIIRMCAHIREHGVPKAPDGKQFVRRVKLDG